MIIRPSEVHEDYDKASLGVGLAAEALGVKLDMRLQTQWLVQLDPADKPAFLALAKEEATRNG